MKIIPSDITYEKRCKTDIKNGKEVNLFVSAGGIILYAENLENQTQRNTHTQKNILELRNELSKIQSQQQKAFAHLYINNEKSQRQ
jgi:hypothetical protein